MRINRKPAIIWFVIAAATFAVIAVVPDTVQPWVGLIGIAVLVYVLRKYVVTLPTTDLLPPECEHGLVGLGFTPVKIDGHFARYTVPDNTEVRDVYKKTPYDWPESEALPNAIIYRNHLMMAYTTGPFAEQKLVLIDY